MDFLRLIVRSLMTRPSIPPSLAFIIAIVAITVAADVVLLIQGAC